ncbi:MAG: DUF5063 domain-containing protein [Muribaculaceae bacterium]|nr:DUF5063 domain-containing protein [Muribaculaceae bacterium]
MENSESRGRMLAVTALCTRYCQALERGAEYEREEFVAEMLGLLPRIYWEFSDIPAGADVSLGEEDEYYSDYVDEDLYESVRRSVERLMGEHDTYLETFEEDMKYSDTPIGASVAEGLADIFQPLYNFICVVKDTEGEGIEGAFRVCKENFENYWAQTLCNVMRPLNAIRYS